MKKKSITQRSKRLLWAVTALLAAALAACAVYLNDYYPADAAAIAVFMSSETILPETPADGVTVYAPEDAHTGLIFYPGGKVEHTAYTPLMKACAAKGILCALVEMPFHLAVLDPDAADGIRELYPEIENWYIGGHSLGGAMAAYYLAEHSGTFQGLILLGAYSTADLSDAALDVLSIYGSEDRVLDVEKYEACRSNLPAGFTEIVLDGGCHAGFGMYGPQKGDGTPAISSQEQITLTAEMIADFMDHGARKGRS